MTDNRFRTFVSAVCAVGMIFTAVVFVVAGQASAQEAVPKKDAGEIIDRVIAVVEDRALLQSEFEMTYRQFLMGSGAESLSAEEEKTRREEVLDMLIGNLLMAVHAEKIGVEVRDEEVNAQVERVLEQRIREMGGIDAFNRELEKAGMTLQQLKDTWSENFRANKLVEEVRYREVYRSIKVTEEEIREYYQGHIDELPKRPPTVELAQILIMMRLNEAEDLNAMKKISDVQEILATGADFAGTAKEYSEGPSAKYGGSLGFMKLADFGNPVFEAAVKKLLVGEVSDPVLTQHGYHIIKLEEVTGDEVLLRHILIIVKRDVDATRAFTEDIRDRIIAGADFGEMAALYSEDLETKDDGGNVGEIPVPNLPEFFTGALRGVADGEIAPLIEDSRGFRIIKMLGRAEGRPYSLKEARNGVRELIERERATVKSTDYIEKLKKIYYVDVKIEV
ncbi:MAG: peptidylprolyl isomerase [Candidatus Krumholzibacteria bacterium]|nr:peptidylprolyl isomerase [Candidatus Krumholzibacteria bacterium]